MSVGVGGDSLSTTGRDAGDGEGGIPGWGVWDLPSRYKLRDTLHPNRLIREAVGAVTSLCCRGREIGRLQLRWVEVGVRDWWEMVPRCPRTLWAQSETL